MAFTSFCTHSVSRQSMWHLQRGAEKQQAPASVTRSYPSSIVQVVCPMALEELSLSVQTVCSTSCPMREGPFCCLKAVVPTGDLKQWVTDSRVFRHFLRENQESPRQIKPKKGQFMNFSRGGVPEQKFNVNRACFPKEKHQNSQTWAKFINFSFWPFLWFGLPGRLLRESAQSEVQVTNFLACSEECGEVFGDNFAPVFQGKLFTHGWSFFAYG